MECNAKQRNAIAWWGMQVPEVMRGLEEMDVGERGVSEAERSGMTLRSIERNGMEWIGISHQNES